MAPSGPPTNPDQTVNFLSQVGFTRQPPMTTWAVQVDSSLQSIDGQTLGYPFVGVIANASRTAVLDDFWRRLGVRRRAEASADVT